MELILFIGMQASGKSTFYHERFRNTHLRINLDMLKTRTRERILVEACFASKAKFVVDNTNPTIEDRARYIVPAKAAGYPVTGYYFETTIDAALARNAGRIGKDRIHDGGLYRFSSTLALPTLAEGFDAIYRVRILETGFEVAPFTV